MGELSSAVGRPRIVCSLIAVAAIAWASLGDDASAARRRRYDPATEASAGDTANTIGTRINSNTLYVVSGNLNGTYVSMAYDLSAVLDDGDNLRVLPVIGKGGGQNIRDVRFLRGVDVGITQSNLLSLFRRTNEIGSIDDKIVYIARLFNEELHVVVRADSGINSIEQLSGKKVNFSDVGSGTQLSTRDILDRLGIKAIETNMGQSDGFEALKRGDIAASILIAGKPTGSTVKLKASDGFRILPVPFNKALQNDYLPTVLTHDDYPNLIEPGKEIDTLAVGAVLIAYNWPQDTDRYRRIAKFVDAFFGKITEFQKPPRHPKWRETNLAATVPGFKRIAAAEEWLATHRKPAAADSAPAATPDTRQRFERFLARNGNSTASAYSEPERERLFQEFIQWNRRQETR